MNDKLQFTTAESAQVSGIPGTHFLQSRQARFRNIVSPFPAIVWVRSGTKRVSNDHDGREVLAGSLTLLPENQPITVENIPAHNKPYKAQILSFDRSYFEAAYQRLTVQAHQRLQNFQMATVEGAVEEAFLRAGQALDQRQSLPECIVQIRCEELVLWLADCGTFLSRPTPISCSDRIRSIIAAEPGSKWSSVEIANKLSLSEASLRRRLRAEGTSFTSVLLEIRMLIALSLLQSTNLNIASIAHQVGYESQSRFSQRFKQRFGLNPGFLRKPATVPSPDNTPAHRR